MADLKIVFQTYSDSKDKKSMSVQAWINFGQHYGLLDNNLYDNAESRLQLCFQLATAEFYKEQLDMKIFGFDHFLGALSCVAVSRKNTDYSKADS